jgi:hypothetical protein
MSKTLTLLKEMIEEDKITIQEVLEACGYKVDVVCTDVYRDTRNFSIGTEEILIGYDEKIIAVKEFR